MAVQPDNFSSLAAYLRLLVQAITQVLAWVSPFAYLTRGLTAIQIANTRSLLFAIGEGLVYVVATLYLAILVLKRRG